MAGRLAGLQDRSSVAHSHPFIIGEVSGQVISGPCLSGLLELFAQHGRGLVGRVTDRHPTRPDPRSNW